MPSVHYGAVLLSAPSAFRTLKHYLIDAGYPAAQFALYRVILGLWK